MRTFGYFALALQAQGGPESGTGGVDFVELIARSNWLTKGVLLILLLFSAVSWGIILYKTWQYRRASRNTTMFLQVFRKSTKFSEVQAVCSSVSASPVAACGSNLGASVARSDERFATASPAFRAASKSAGMPDCGSEKSSSRISSACCSMPSRPSE